MVDAYSALVAKAPFGALGSHAAVIKSEASWPDRRTG